MAGGFKQQNDRVRTSDGVTPLLGGLRVLGSSQQVHPPKVQRSPTTLAVGGLSRATQNPRMARDESPVLLLRAGSDDPLVGM